MRNFCNSQNTNQPETKEVEKVKMILDVFYKKFNNGSDKKSREENWSHYNGGNNRGNTLENQTTVKLYPASDQA